MRMSIVKKQFSKNFKNQNRSHLHFPILLILTDHPRQFRLNSSRCYPLPSPNTKTTVKPSCCLCPFQFNQYPAQTQRGYSRTGVSRQSPSRKSSYRSTSISLQIRFSHYNRSAKEKQPQIYGLSQKRRLRVPKASSNKFLLFLGTLCRY